MGEGKDECGTNESNEEGRMTEEQMMKLMEEFANLIAAVEREACAALCFQMWNKWLDSEDRSEFTRPDAEDCAAAIRARGQV